MWSQAAHSWQAPPDFMPLASERARNPFGAANFPTLMRDASPVLRLSLVCLIVRAVQRDADRDTGFAGAEATLDGAIEFEAYAGVDQPGAET